VFKQQEHLTDGILLAKIYEPPLQAQSSGVVNLIEL
jgi:hypothetical protein